MSKKIIHTDLAPQAIGTYSQAVRVGQVVYISGQIPLVPGTMQLISSDIHAQVKQVFENLQAIVHASQATFDEIVKVTIYLTDLTHFALVNEVMAHYFQAPYPARAVLGVQSLPRGAQIEIEAIIIQTKELA
ncbi:MAG: RidA family protein [Gammaproteobacteria bacterium]|nr:RidA family protein [Gammaproteobacteria bacterium]